MKLQEIYFATYAVFSELEQLAKEEIDDTQLSQGTLDLLGDYALDMHADDPRIVQSMKGRDADPSDWIYIVAKDPQFMKNFGAWWSKKR